MKMAPDVDLLPDAGGLEEIARSSLMETLEKFSASCQWQMGFVVGCDMSVEVISKYPIRNRIDAVLDEYRFVCIVSVRKIIIHSYRLNQQENLILLIGGITSPERS